MQSNTISVQSAIKDGLLFSFVVWKCLNHKLVKAIHPVTLSSLLCTLLSLDVFFLQISNIMLSNRFHSRILARQENSKVFMSKDRCQTEGRFFFSSIFQPCLTFLENICPGCSADQLFQKWTWFVQYLLIYMLTAFYAAMHTSLSWHVYITTNMMNI